MLGDEAISIELQIAVNCRICGVKQISEKIIKSFMVERTFLSVLFQVRQECLTYHTLK